MSVSRETSMSPTKYFNQSINHSLSYSVNLHKNDELISFFVSLNPGSFLVVKDNDFLSIFNILYKTNIPNLSVLTNLKTDSPPGFISPLKRSIDNYIINENNPHRIVLINQSCYKGEYPYYFKGVVGRVDESADYDQLLSYIQSSDLIRVSTVVGPGTYTVRGSLIDVYPLESRVAFRVDFSYDSPRLFVFDASSQLTVKVVDSFSFIVSRPSYSKIKTSKLLEGLRFSSYLGGYYVLGLGDKKVYLNTCNYDSYDGDFKNCVSTDLLSSTGVYINDYLFVPPWFLGEAPKTQSRPVAVSLLDGFDGLVVGDCLVHEEYGVCLFDGVVEGLDGDESFVSLVFKDGKISLPVSRLFLLSLFNGVGGKERLNSLSKKGVWLRKKQAVSKRVSDFVKELLDQHVSRMTRTIKRGVLDLKAVQDFVLSFQYEDTEDQKKSFEEIMYDLTSPSPMDRLLCGDVGFGKTEIAIRAAFISVLLGNKVIVLAPTTILCNQLLDSFRSRLNPFAINVEMISRLNSTYNTNKNIEDFNSGAVDVLVCTHKILSHIDRVSSLGLLIIDEEHRFGVKQKESFVGKFPLLDILSMSATPIPRSLQNAFSGIKTISSITTPPINRLPIQTTIDYFDYDRIVEYIKYEVLRSGQVYLLHNNIQSLGKIQRVLSEACPDISFGVVHGQMPVKHIEKTVADFSSGTFQVLISTTIIENGLDISNVNTIIINNAHLFGLSQLHQIRGRVGRHSRQAYAYLLIPKNLKLNQDGKRRLKAIEENVALGSGYNLSSKDLEIRGSGSVFGYSQSGGSQVGFDLYNKILKESINVLRDGNKKNINDVVVQLDIEKGFIPTTYIEEDGLRISLYKSLLACSTIKELDVFQNNLVDRFGKCPNEVASLLRLQRLKVLCLLSNISSIIINNNEVRVFFLPGEYINNTIDFISWVSSFFKESGFVFSFKEGSGNRIILCFNINNTKKDIYVFLVDLLNKFKHDFLEQK